MKTKIINKLILRDYGPYFNDNLIAWSKMHKVVISYEFVQCESYKNLVTLYFDSL